MTVEWKNFALGEVCKFTTGSAFKHIYQGKLVGKYPFIKVSDMNLSSNEIYIRVANNYIDESILKLSKAKLHKRNSIVFAKIGVALTTNRRRMLITDTAIDNNMMSAAALEEYITSQYLYYLLCTLDFNLIAAGTALPYINISDLQKWQIALPSFAEQTRIGNFLIAIDKKIDLLKETNKTLEAIAQAIFKSWFIDFDPVHAKQKGVECAGIDKSTADLFPSSFVESELGLIPKDWVTTTIGEVLDRLKTKNRYGKDNLDAYGSIPVYEQGVSILMGYRLGEPEYVASTSNPIVIFGDHTCVTKILLSPFDISSNVIAFQGKSLATSWVYYAIKDKQHFEEYRRHWGELIVKKIVIPNVELCDHYSKIVMPLLSKIDKNEKQISNLSLLRDLVLPRLISGKLDLSSIEAQLEEVE